MPRSSSWRLALILVVALIVATSGCREDSESLTGPEIGQSLKTNRLQALSFRQVSAGWVHTCGVTRDNLAYCWGSNFGGQLGEGTTTDRLRPVAIAGGLRFRDVSAGMAYTCGLTSDDLAYCWGQNSAGQLGNGTTSPSLTPVAVAGGLRFRQVSTGSFHTCGVTRANQAFCWGSIGAGRGNEIGGEARYLPFEVGAGLRFREVSASLVSSALGNFSCGVTLDDVAYCWGENEFGQLGIGSIGGLSWSPVQVAGGLPFRSIGAGATRTCGLTPERLAYCWGANWYGAVGDGTYNIRRPAPVRVSGGLRFRELSYGGEYHTCGITQPGRAYCWGRNFEGQVGDGTTTNRLTPVPVAGRLRFRQLGTGTSHTCGVVNGNVAYCWGANYAGQLGDGTTSPSLTPVAVAAPGS